MCSLWRIFDGENIDGLSIGRTGLASPVRRIWTGRFRRRTLTRCLDGAATRTAISLSGEAGLLGPRLRADRDRRSPECNRVEPVQPLSRVRHEAGCLRRRARGVRRQLHRPAAPAPRGAGGRRARTGRVLSRALRLLPASRGGTWLSLHQLHCRARGPRSILLAGQRPTTSIACGRRSRTLSEMPSQRVRWTRKKPRDALRC